jgi:hypothetical protein
MSFWSAAFSAIGSAISGRSQSRAQRQQADRDAATRRQELLYGAGLDRNMAMWERGNELEDRRYRQESFGNYRQFNRTPGIESPEYSSTTPTNLELPEFIDPGKPKPPKKKSLLNYGA